MRQKTPSGFRLQGVGLIFSVPGSQQKLQVYRNLHRSKKRAGSGFLVYGPLSSESAHISQREPKPGSSLQVKKTLNFELFPFCSAAVWFMLRFMVHGLWFTVYNLWFMVYSVWFMVYG